MGVAQLGMGVTHLFIIVAQFGMGVAEVGMGACSSVV